MNTYKNNKLFFNFLIKKNYKIIKEQNSNEIIKISFDNNEVKCKYILLFTQLKTNQANNLKDKFSGIMWSFENPYIDQKTKNICQTIKNNIEDNIRLSDGNDNINNTINKIINYIIKSKLTIRYNDEIIKPLWIITDNSKEYKQFYLITDIIYF